MTKISQQFNTTTKHLKKGKSLCKGSKVKTKLTAGDIPEDQRKFAKENGIPLKVYVNILNKYISEKNK